MYLTSWYRGIVTRLGPWGGGAPRAMPRMLRPSGVIVALFLVERGGASWVDGIATFSGLATKSPPPHATIVHGDERHPSDSHYLGNAQWPMVHTRQCPHKDGFYSALRFLLPLIFFPVSLASHTNEFIFAMPDLWYDEQVSGQPTRVRGPVPFLKIYDGRYLRGLLRGAGVTNARPFYDCEAPNNCRKIRLSADNRSRLTTACRQPQQPDIWHGLGDSRCWRGHLWNESEARCSPGSAKQLAKLLAHDARLSKTTGAAPAHYLLDGAGGPPTHALLDQNAPWTAWVRNFERSARWTGDHDDRMRITDVNASHEEPMKVHGLGWTISDLPSTAVIQAFDALRAAPAVRRVADFIIRRHWGLADGERFVAYHLRRGSTYALVDRAAVMKDVEAYNASSRTGLPGVANMSTAYQRFLGHTLDRMAAGKSVDWHALEIAELYQDGPAEMTGALRRALVLSDEPPCMDEGGAAVRHVVLSTFPYAQQTAAKVLAGARERLTVLTFDPATWVAVRDASIHGWDPDEPLMRDAVETEVWMRAAVFIGGRSTMASMTKMRRHAMRGMSYDGASKACVVDSSPCDPDPRVDLESEERLACR